MSTRFSSLSLVIRCTASDNEKASFSIYRKRKSEERKSKLGEREEESMQAGAGAKFEAETDRKAESAITYIIRGRDRWVN